MKKREYIYILLHDVEDKHYIKVGFTSNLKQRISNYRCYNPSIKLIYVKQLTNAKRFEYLFHKKNTAVYRNEWYPSSLLKKVKFFMSKWNEKYPINIYEYEPFKKKSLRKERTKLTFDTMVDYFRINNVNGKINDWGEYSSKIEWIETINNCYSLYGKVGHNISSVKKRYKIMVKIIHN